MEVKQIQAALKELEGARDADRILEVLESFDKQLQPTEQLLRETKVGVAVNKLRTHSDNRVSALVKRMVTRWKEQVSAQKKRAQAGDTASQRTTTATTTEKSQSSGPRSAKSDGVKTDLYPDRVRNSCVELSYTALASDSKAASKRILEVAKAVEAVVFVAEKGTSSGYRTKMRSLYLNLKDPKNPALRQRLVSGSISAERLRSMTPQEMAPEELKRELAEIHEQNLFNARGATEKRATTDRFVCGKCKERKVSYYQMQTRSADEPLTTFCTCEHCGNRWKFC